MYKETLFLLTIWIINQCCDASVCEDTNCINGKCEYNVCHCQQCYTGQSCELIENKSPIFEQSVYQVVLNQNTIDENIILKVTANDEDKCPNINCGCGQIFYSILEENAREIFEIDSNTGEIRIIKGAVVPQIKYSFTVKATNKSPFDNTYDTTTIFLNVDTSNEILERHRRDVAPAKPLFVLSQIFPVQNLTVINIGQRLTLQLNVTFPVGTTTLSVELFAPETSTDSVMMICNVAVVSVGSQLTTNTFNPPLQEGINGTVWPYTHIVYNFSNVVNNQASPVNIADIQIIITFDAVMLYSPSTQDATTYYISGGSEYLNGTEIWVGQLGYIVNMSTPNPKPNITISGDTMIYPGRTAAFVLNIQAPDSYLYLNMAIYTPLNNSVALSLCVVYRYYVGAAYSCLPTNYNQPTLSSVTINNQYYYTQASMNLGVLGNRYYMEPSHTDMNEKTINVSVTARVNSDLWTGSNYYVGFSISNTITTIYTSTYQVLALPAPTLTPYTSTISYSLGYHRNVTVMNIGTPGRIALNITIPTGTELDYTIIARTTDNTSEICGLLLFKAGLNIPCVDQINFVTTYVASPDNYAIKATILIGGVRHVKISNNTDDDVLQLLVVYRPINDSRNSPAATSNIGVTVNWIGGNGTEQTLPITLDVPSVSNVNSTTLPVFTFQLKGNDGNISVGSAYQLFFSMRLTPGVIYTPTSLEFYMPFNNTVRVGMCQVTINYVGKNVLCFNPTLMTQKFVYSSKINDTSNYDKLQIPIGVLCTSGSSNIPASINDEVQITISILILPHSMNTVGATANLNGGMMITNTQIWVGNQPLTFINKPAYPALSSPNIPLIYAQRVDAINNNVWQNDLAIIQYIIKVPPSLVTQMSLTISSNIVTNNNFGVCQIIIKKQGSSIPCVNGTMSTTPWIPFSKYYKNAVFAFTDILNTGAVPLTTNPTFDENSLLVEVVVKFGTGLPSTFTVTATLTSNGPNANANVIFQLQTALSRFNGTLSSTEPVFSMVLSPLFNNTQPIINNIAYSEASRSIVGVQVQPGVLQSLKVIFASTPSVINQMDVLSVNILSVGRNIPCFQTGMIPYVVQQRTGSLSMDLTSVDLGTICHRQYLTNTTIEDNKIYIEAVFRVWKVPANYPSTLQINMIALLNNDQVYVTRIVFNSSTTTSYINDINLLAQTINASATVSASSVSVGGIFTINVTLAIPPYTQFRSGGILVYSPNPPGSDSYYFISGNVNYTGVFGKNIGINQNEPLPMILRSSMNTSQMDYMLADFGVVQNFATTYRMNQANYSSPTLDDTLSALISVQLTDNTQAPNGQVINFYVGINFGSFVTNVSLQVTVNRTNTETIDFNATNSLLTTNNIYTSTTPIIASVQAIMANTSTLECRNFTIYVAAPPFITLSGLVNSSYSSPGFQIQQNTLPLGGFSFSVPYFFYKENISIIFTMTVLPGLNISKGRAQSALTIPLVYACQTLNWPLNPLGNKFFNKVNTLLFTVKGNDVNNTVSNCNNDLKLTDNTVIKDCAISAYMSPYTGFEPVKIRSNSGSYWVPHMRSGQYNKLRYIDIKFGTLTTVAKIVVTSSIANQPQIISIHGTMDGRVFSSYQNITLSYNGGITASPTLNNPPFTFRGIRVSILNALQDDQVTGMNLDLFGCTPPNVTDTFTFDPCTTKSYSIPSTPLPDFYYRGYLYISPYIFVCDEIASRTSGLETFPRCFRANQATNFTTWEDLGNQVGKVIGFDSSNLIIYAIASDVKSYIMSEDNGVTWTGINGGGWQILKNLGSLQSPTILPWTNDTTFDYLTTGTNCTKYNTGTLYFCYDGIYSGSTRTYSWNNCCNL